MAKILGVSAITERIKARVTQIEDQLKQHQNLTDELERLRSALARLEGEIRTRVNAGRRGGRQPASTPKSAAAAEAAAERKSAAAPVAIGEPNRAAARTPRGQNKANIIEGAQGRPEDRIRDLQADRHRHRHREHDTHQDGKGRRDRKSRTRLRTPAVANTR